MNLTVLENNNQRVLTTKQLAEVYETEEVNIRNNFKNNKERFTVGKHYFELTGECLRIFKREVNDIYSVPQNVNKLILWTEKGASRMCKILDTDRAWERFDELEECYFNVKENKTIVKEISVSDKYKTELEGLGIISNLLNFNDSSKLLGVKTICEKYGMETSYLPEYTKSKGVLKTATELLKANNIGISAQKFNKIKKFKNLINTEFGENLVNPKNNKETQPMYYENKFLELLKFIGFDV